MKGHGLKFQAITLPNGMYGNAWGAALSHNDRGMINMSGLEEYLSSHVVTRSVGNDEDGWFYPAVYGDSIYVPSEVIQKAVDINAIEGNREMFKTLNRRLNRSRTSIENHFGLMFNEWALLEVKGRHKLVRNKGRVYKLGIVAFFLTNCYTCFRGNSISKRFGMNRITLDEYIPLNEVIEPFVEDVDDEFMDGEIFA